MKIRDFLRMTTKSMCLKPFRSYPKVMSPEKTISYIKKNGCSISRFGDGELSLMEKRDLSFQKYDKNLATRLENVKNSKNCLVCIPDIFDGKRFTNKIIVKKEYDFWRKQKFFFGGLWKKRFSNKVEYGNAFVSRFYYRFKDKSNIENYIKLLKTLWNDRNILIVEGATSQIGVGNDILDNVKSIRRIICPNTNAFQYYEEICNAIDCNYRKNDLVILALGPTATLLSFELSKKSNGQMQLLDLGHFDIEYEWFLAKAIEKMPVKNKHVNECDSIGKTNENDPMYYRQIVKRIG